MDDQHFVDRLRPLIGSRFNHLGKTWVLIEVLENEGKLVFVDTEKSAFIQSDQYGQPLRRGPENLLIPLYGSEPDTLSEELLEILSNKCG